jgi:hypothetical protein
MNAPARVRAPHSPPTTRVDPLKVFVARAEARAQLWYDGELTLHDALDELWASAVRDGLVNQLGADEVQRILADAFAPLRTDLPRDEDVVPDLIGEDENQADIVNLKSADDDYDGLPRTFAKLCREADEKQAREPVDPRIERARRLLDDDMSLERAWNEIYRDRGRVTEVTLEAAEFLIREKNPVKLRAWLAKFTAQECEAILQRVEQRRKAREK